MKKRVRAAERSFDNYASQFVKDITGVQAYSLEPHQKAGSTLFLFRGHTMRSAMTLLLGITGSRVA
jgi:hypothetical protein